MLNKNELILDKVRSLTAHDLETQKLLFRLTSLEDPSLQCTAEGEEITDAIGSVITTLYRAKKAVFSATNSLISTDLLAAQYGTKKEVAGETDNPKTITDYTYEILTATEGKIKLANVPTKEIKYIYSMQDGEIATAYVAAATGDTEATATTFILNKEAKEITVPSGVTGKFYVEYEYASENAMQIVNKASQFPEACGLIVYAYFKDKCNENIVYSGKIVAPKAKLNPEQVELALTSTGKHAFEFSIMKDYCADEDAELFTIIIAQ